MDVQLRTKTSTTHPSCCHFLIKMCRPTLPHCKRDFAGQCVPLENFFVVIKNEKFFQVISRCQSMHQRLSCRQTRLECFRQCGPPGSGTAVALRTISTSFSLTTSIAASSYIRKKDSTSIQDYGSQFQKVANVSWSRVRAVHCGKFHQLITGKPDHVNNRITWHWLSIISRGKSLLLVLQHYYLVLQTQAKTVWGGVTEAWHLTADWRNYLWRQSRQSGRGSRCPPFSAY